MMNSNHSFSWFWLLMKLQRLFFAVCWRLFMLIYFCIGLGALVVLFLIESQFFIHVTQHTLLGYGIFGHISATQSREIEHLFETKMHRLNTKKNCYSFSDIKLQMLRLRSA